MNEPEAASPAGAVILRGSGSSRAARVAGVLALLLGLGSLPLLTHRWFFPARDAVMYVETARALATGEGYTYLGIPFLVRPPGYAVLIAPLLGLGESAPWAIHLLNGLLGLAGCAALYAFAQRRMPWPGALLAVACLWLNPEVRRLQNQVMSDVAGLAVLGGCLLLERRAAQRPSVRGDLLLGLAIGLGSYVRTGVVLLVPAILVARLVARLREGGERPGPWLARRALPVTLAALAVALPWSVRNALVAPEPPADQTLVYEYSTGIWHEDAGDPSSPRLPLGEVLARSSQRLPEVVGSVTSRLQASETSGPGEVAFGLACLAAVLVLLWRRTEPAELFALGLLAVLAFYFGYNRRLALPILVVALLALVEVLGLLGRRLAGRRGAVVASCLVPLALIAADFRPGKGWEGIEAREVEARELAARLAPHLRPKERLASFEGFEYTARLGRPVYSLCFALRRAGGDPDAALPALLEKRRIDAVLLSTAVPGERKLISWFRPRCGKPTTVGDVQIYRLP